MTRIALIHALKHSIPPIEDAFARLWPDVTLQNILDDSLSSDLSRDAELTLAMTDRFISLARYAARTGADGILFTCSAFGPCIDGCIDALAPLPVLKPNEAMVEQANRMGEKIGLLASFSPTLASMPSEFAPGKVVVARFAQGAMNALDSGDLVEHDRLAALAARGLLDCDVIALAQFSLARAAKAVAAATMKPVLTTPDCAVLELRRRMSA